MKIHRLVFCLGAFIATILLGGFSQAQEKPVVMVADFELVGVPVHLKASLSGRLQAGVAATGKYRTTDPTVTRKALSEQARQQKMTDCYAEECLAKVGKALGASEMIVGTITKVKERFYTVDLKLVNISLLTSMNTVSESSRGDIEATYEAIDRAIARLLGVEVGALPSQPSQEFGALSVNTGIGGTQVYLDGQYQGAISEEGEPLRISNLTAGRHTVRVEHPDYQAKERDIVVKPNILLRLNLTLAAISGEEEQPSEARRRVQPEGVEKPSAKTRGWEKGSLAPKFLIFVPNSDEEGMKDFSTGIGLGIDGRFNIAKHFAIGAELNYIGFSTYEGTYSYYDEYMDEYYDMDLKATFSTIAIKFNALATFPINKFTPFAGFGLVYNSATLDMEVSMEDPYTYELMTVEESASGSGLGFQVVGGFDYHFSNKGALTAEISIPISQEIDFEVQGESFGTWNVGGYELVVGYRFLF